MFRPLIAHPAQDLPALAIEAHCARAGNGLTIAYRISGPITALRIPAPATPDRTDNLWKHTCFEAFVRPDERSGSYFEFNFSPSTQWAAYRFSGYRQGMTPLAVPTPNIVAHVKPESMELRVSLALGALTDLVEAPRWRAGLSAVIEHDSGAMSYWALAHAPGKPDFHHADCFVLDLERA